MPISSQFPSVEIPEVDIFSFIFNRKDRPFPETKVIYQDADDISRQYTYANVRDAAIVFAKGLRSKFDIRKNDVVGLFAPNDIDIAPIVFGSLWAGAIISPANPGYTVAELAFQLKDSAAKIVLTCLPALDTVKQACAQVGIAESNIVLLGAARDPSRKFKHWTSVINEEGTFRMRTPKIAPKTDLAFLVYSSGTTGRPKGVELTHRNLISNILQNKVGDGGCLTWDGSHTVPGIKKAPSSGDKVLACLPFFHIYGLTCLVISPIYTGIHEIVLARFEIEKFCQLIQDHQVTYSFIVPPMVLLLSKHPAVAKYDFSSLRMTNSGAAPLTRELSEAVFKRLGVKVKQGYGLSETSPTAFAQRWQDWDVGMGSVGWLVANMEAKFCKVPGPEGHSDDPMNSKELPQGEVGELYVKGPNVFKGYHNNKAATAECLDSAGWFRTGDVGYVDKRGDLYITDRVKELIKYKGFQVPPAELEGYLVDHELVDDVAVIGIESEELGTEVPRAYIVRKGGLKAVQRGDDQKIMKWFETKVANHKKLRGGIRFVESVPKSASGKILRRLLKDEAKKEAAEQVKKTGKAKL